MKMRLIVLGSLQVSGGGPCRECTLDANVGDKPEQLHGTACRQNDGNWKAQS